MKAEELLAHTDFLGALARSLLRDEHSAADVTQETWLAALQRPSGDLVHPRAWLAQVVRNFARMAYRGEHRRNQRERSAARPEGTLSTDEVVAQEELRSRVVQAVLSLDEPYRSTVLLRFYKDLSHKEVARRLGVPLETMRTRLKKGLALLKKRLDGLYEGDRKQWLAALIPFTGWKLSPEGAGAAAGSSTAITGGWVMATNVKIALVAAMVVLSGFITVWTLIPEGEGPEYEPVRVVSGEAQQADKVQQSKVANLEKVALLPSSKKEAQSAEVPAGEQWLEGRFIDRDGLPVADVQVEDSSRSRLLGKSAANGRFRGPLKNIPIGSFGQMSITAHKPGYATLRRFIEWQGGESFNLGDLVFEPGGSLVVRVFAEQGAPLANAQVVITDTEMSPPSDYRRQGPIDPGTRMKSDGTGAFSAAGIPVGWVRVWAVAHGFYYAFTSPVKIEPGRETRGVDLYLETRPAETHITGTLIDPQGKPLAEAEVKASWSNRPYGTGRMGYDTDAEGRFRIPTPNPVPYELNFFDAENRYTQETLKEVEPGTEDLLVQLAPLDRLRLKISLDVDRNPGKLSITPKVDAEDTGDRVYEFLADEWRKNQVLEIEVPRRIFYLIIDLPGYRGVREGPFVAGDYPDPLVISLSALPILEGVVENQGRPLAGVKVSIHPENKDQFLINGFRSYARKREEGQGFSDESGRYHIPLKNPGVYYVRAEKQGFAPLDHGPINLLGKNDQPGPDFMLTQGGSIEGRVLMPPGREPAGVIIGFSRGDGFAFSKRVGADGLFRVAALTPGNWLVKPIENEIHSRHRSTRHGAHLSENIPWTLIVEEGKTTHWDLNLSAGEGFYVAGFLTLDGLPPEAWTARLIYDGKSATSNPRTDCSLDLKGGFKVHGSMEGNYFLTLTGNHGQCGRFTLLDKGTLSAGENKWHCDLATGWLTFKNKPDRKVSYMSYQWQGQGKRKVSVDLEGATPGETIQVPAGPGQLVYGFRIAPDRFEFDERQIELTIPQGETVEITLD